MTANPVSAGSPLRDRVARSLDERREPGVAELCDALERLLDGAETSRDTIRVDRLQKGVYRLHVGGGCSAVQQMLQGVAQLGDAGLPPLVQAASELLPQRRHARAPAIWRPNPRAARSAAAIRYEARCCGASGTPPQPGMQLMSTT